MRDTLHIAFSTDDNYVQHLAACIVSLLENNKNFEKIIIHILENGVSVESKKKLEQLVHSYHHKIDFYEVQDLLMSLNKNYQIPATISISSYARLFLSKLLSSDIEKIIYADCDALFLGSLQELWNSDFGDCILMGAQDHVGEANKIAIDLHKNANYINAGFLLLNLKKIREESYLDKMIQFIAGRGGVVMHHDQGIINGVFKDNIIFLPAKYNVMTSFFDFKTVEDIKKYYQTENYYTQQEINDAKVNPVFLHLTPGFSKRPWIKGSRHPLKAKYWEYLQKTPWKQEKPQIDQRNLKYKVIENVFWIFGPRFYKKLFSK